MTAAITRTRALVFEHDDRFVGEVVIRRGNQSMTVPIEDLQAFVGEKLRAEAITDLQSLKPGEFLARRTARGAAPLVRSIA